VLKSVVTKIFFKGSIVFSSLNRKSVFHGVSSGEKGVFNSTIISNPL